MLLSFERPQYLFLLVLFPLVWAIHFFSSHLRRKKALKFANFDAISKIEGIDFFSRSLMIPFLSSLIVLFLVLSISGTVLHMTPLKGSSFYSFVIAIDSSRSMGADDFFPNRLTAAKESAINFVKETPTGTKIGVVSFSSFTYIEQELTENKNDLVYSISNINLSQYGGTDFYEALITAANLLNEQRNKAIIFVSDGQNNIGDATRIIDYANKQDISINAIAIGTKEGGKTEYSVSELNEEFLRNITEQTGGQYFSAKDQSTLALSFANILRLTKNKASLHLSTYLLLFALILFVIDFFLINIRYFNYV